jgi:predicted tellurium resistance membrane protein TerC
MRGLIRVVFIGLTGVFVLVILLGALCAALLAVVWSLLMGRKPTLFTVTSRFRQASEQFRGGSRMSRSAHHSAESTDVVDVQAHEVREVLGGPASTPKNSNNL